MQSITRRATQEDTVPQPDDFDPAAFQAFCARFGIEATPYTDAFGRTDFKLDRANVEKLAHLKQLADRHEEQQ